MGTNAVTIWIKPMSGTAMTLVCAAQILACLGLEKA